MNKKILVLAFVSAAFLFGCAADGAFTSESTNPSPPAWDAAPSTANPSAGGDGLYCYAGGMCIKFNGYYTAKDCLKQGAVIINSCPFQ